MRCRLLLFVALLLLIRFRVANQSFVSIQFVDVFVGQFDVFVAFDLVVLRWIIVWSFGACVV